MTTSDADDQIMRGLIHRERAGERSTIRIYPHSVVVLSWVVSWASHPGPMIEWAPDIFAPINAELATLLDGDPQGGALRQWRELVPVQVGPYTAVMLLGAITGWLRQPQSAEHGLTFMTPVTDALTALFTGDEAVLEMIHRLNH